MRKADCCSIECVIISSGCGLETLGNFGGKAELDLFESTLPSSGRLVLEQQQAGRRRSFEPSQAFGIILIIILIILAVIEGLSQRQNRYRLQNAHN